MDSLLAYESAIQGELQRGDDGYSGVISRKRQPVSASGARRHLAAQKCCRHEAALRYVFPPRRGLQFRQHLKYR